MTNRETMELFIEKNGQETVAYPFVEKDHVVFGNGMGIEEVIEQDISMPTVTHEEVSFKVGVGDQDVSSSIVDSSVGEMVIKGQTYHNILPEPSTHVLTNNKEMFKVNEGLDPNVEIVDGVSKSAILKGQTLVNIINSIENPRYNFIDYNLSFTDNTKTYYVKFDSSFPVSEIGLLENVNAWNGNKIEINSTNGYAILTPNKDIPISGLRVRFDTNEDTAYIPSVNLVCIEYQDGMENWNIDYFEGMQSVKMSVLTTTGKNLLPLGNSQDLSARGLIVTQKDGKLLINGVTTGTTDYRVFNSNNNVEQMKKFNSLPVGTTITLSNNLGKECYFNVTRNGSSIYFKNTITIEDGDENINAFIRFNANETHDNTELYVQIEYGAVATSYEPYKTNILTVNEEVELRGIGEGSNRVEDELDCLTGEVVEYIDEIMFDGSSDENWVIHTQYADSIVFRLTLTKLYNSQYCACDRIMGVSGTTAFQNGIEQIKVGSSATSTIYVNILNSKLSSIDVVGFKTWLQSNPINIQLVLATPVIKTVDLSIIDQDGNTPEGLHFFKDGHIQLSSGADNSLIPTLDYQAKTSNSYVMDLMKTNTKYTMKAKSASGTFTIDGTSYGAGTNGTFTTPTSMTNKLLVMSDKTHEEVMIIEGDVTDKTIPYFKGIKSAFEGEDKIEVLSTGKNLADVTTVYTNMNSGYNDRHWTIVQKDENGFIAKVKNYPNTEGTHRAFSASLKVYVEPNTTYYLSYDTKDNGTVINSHTYVYSNCETWGRSVIKNYTEAQNGFTFTTHSDTEYIVIGLGYTLLENNKEVEVSNLILSRSKTTYEPYKSNSTKIPLLSPLRSLPNGVCDELIIDRMKKKVTLIQRVGHSVINSEFAKNGGKWGNTKDTDPCWGFHCGNYVQGSFKLNEHNSINDKLPIKPMVTTGDPLMGYHQSNPHIALRREEMCDMKMALNWLDRNPIDFYYQLETPVITEVDLEGFPYIYKDGHIFLNSEIAPNTQITYSISQQHQISASTQDLIRHEQELVYLYKLIAQYIQVDYQSTLLSLDLKLK